MALAFTNSSITFLAATSYRRYKSKPNPPADKAYFEKRKTGPSITHDTSHDGSFDVRGPQEAHWTVRRASDGDQTDPMHMNSWQRFSARCLFFSTLIPTVLAPYSLYLQMSGLLEMTREQLLPPWMLRVAWSMIIVDGLMKNQGLPQLLIKSSTLMGKWRRRLRLVGHEVPRVDVVIPCCREPLDVLQDTILASLAIDYPENQFRVIVSDDGASMALKSWCAGLGRPNLFYTARVKTGPAGYKAGNINHAVRFIESKLKGDPAEFIASLDADMIPEKHWLRAVTPHILMDRRLGMVVPTQGFYNFPMNDPLNQSNRRGWRFDQVMHDMAGCAWNTGSGFILRREALLSIGGFPTDCLTEDVYSSMLMVSRGWKTAYLAECLQYGLVPDTFRAHVMQLVRWNNGGFQIAANFGCYLSKKKNGLLRPFQKIVGISQGIGTIQPLFGVISIITLPLLLFSGFDLLYANDLDHVRLLLRIQCICNVGKWLHDCNAGFLIGYSTAIREGGLTIYMAPWYALAILRGFVLPRAFGGTEPGFTPTGSISDHIHERHAIKRAPLCRRLHHVLFHCGAWFHAILILVYVCAVAFRTRRVLAAHPSDLRGQRDWHALSIDLLRYVAWPQPAWLLTIIGLSTPIKYAIAPPIVPPRDELLGKRDEKGARYPLPQYRDSSVVVRNLEFANLYTIIVLYDVCLFIASWWI